MGGALRRVRNQVTGYLAPLHVQPTRVCFVELTGRIWPSSAVANPVGRCARSGIHDNIFIRQEYAAEVPPKSRVDKKQPASYHAA